MTQVKGIFIVGTLPPPVHGNALVTAAVMKRLTSLGAKVTMIDLSADSINRSIFSRFARVRKIIFGLVKFIGKIIVHSDSVVYLAISGGLGQIYDFFFVCIARIFDLKIYLHHHNIGYINHHRTLTQYLFWMAGKTATHIVASEGICNALGKMYSVATKTLSMSAVIVADPPRDFSQKDRMAVRTLGFIGNISKSKGIIDFLEMAEMLRLQGCDISCLIAGPFQEDEVKKEVLARLETLPNVYLIGAVSGEKKLEFFNAIDVLIFPARDEYEGIVVHEAMSFGVPVIARESGCIGGIVNSGVGYLVAEEADFNVKAWAGISEWIDAPMTLRAASMEARKKFIQFREKNLKMLDQLCFELMGMSK